MLITKATKSGKTFWRFEGWGWILSEREIQEYLSEPQISFSELSEQIKQVNLRPVVENPEVYNLQRKNYSDESFVKERQYDYALHERILKVSTNTYILMISTAEPELALWTPEEEFFGRERKIAEIPPDERYKLIDSLYPPSSLMESKFSPHFISHKTGKVLDSDSSVFMRQTISSITQQEELFISKYKGDMNNSEAILLRQDLSSETGYRNVQEFTNIYKPAPTIDILARHINSRVLSLNTTLPIFYIATTYNIEQR